MNQFLVQMTGLEKFEYLLGEYKSLNVETKNDGKLFKKWFNMIKKNVGGTENSLRHIQKIFYSQGGIPEKI